MRYIVALDIHKRETQACVTDLKGKAVKQARFDTTPEAFRAALSKYHDGHAIIDTVGIYRPVSKWLKDMGFTVHLANTSRIPKPAIKTDKKDAAHYARLFRADSLPESYLPSDEVQRLRDLARHRRFLGVQERRWKAKIMLDLQKHGHFVDPNPVITKTGRAWLQRVGIPEIQSSYLAWQHIDEQIRGWEARLEKEAEHPMAQLLLTIPGVGAYSAMLVIAEIGDINRFATKDSLSAYAGLAVRQYQTGDTDTRGAITKTGSPNLRWILGQCARLHVRYCPDGHIAKRFQRLMKRKGYSIAITATARVLLTVMYVMLKRKEAFKLNPP